MIAKLSAGKAALTLSQVEAPLGAGKPEGLLARGSAAIKRGTPRGFTAIGPGDANDGNPSESLTICGPEPREARNRRFCYHCVPCLLARRREGGEIMATAKHYTHITFEMRVSIENYVVEGRTLAYVSRELGVDATSISRELKRNRRCDGHGGSLTSKNKCVHRKTCKRRAICDPDCKKRCASCGQQCHDGRCPDFEEEWCKRTHRAPFVCNGCAERRKCPLERWTYSAKAAQAKADSRLVESREGLDMTGHEMAFLAGEVKAGLEKGQSVHHIFASRDDLPCSERSFYRHVENEAIDVRKMDLRKKVKYKKRNKKKASRREKEFYAGREFSDYMELDADIRAATVQMDCVEGAEGDEQALLTLHFVALRFQIYVLLAKKDSARVVAALDWIEGLCGKRAFKKLFGLILTDRGSEFDDIAGIEKGGRCSVYYTDPQRSDQKGACEKAHVELRKVIEKGTSIDGLGLDAWLVAGICSHVNSSMRLSIGDASPMALAKAALPAPLLEGLGLELVPPDEVEARPELIERLKQERDNKQR